MSSFEADFTAATNRLLVHVRMAVVTVCRSEGVGRERSYRIADEVARRLSGFTPEEWESVLEREAARLLNEWDAARRTRA